MAIAKSFICKTEMNDFETLIAEIFFPKPSIQENLKCLCYFYVEYQFKILAEGLQHSLLSLACENIFVLIG